MKDFVFKVKRMPVAAMRLLLISRVGRPTRSSVVPKIKKNRPMSCQWIPNLSSDEPNSVQL